MPLTKTLLATNYFQLQDPVNPECFFGFLLYGLPMKSCKPLAPATSLGKELHRLLPLHVPLTGVMGNQSEHKGGFL